VNAVVHAVSYVPNPDGLTLSEATLSVVRSSRAAPATLVVVQIGGPAWSPTGGELQQLEGDPLLLPAQQVILLLHPRGGGNANEYQTVYGAGVYPIVNGVIQVAAHNPLADQVTGLTANEAFDLFR